MKKITLLFAFLATISWQANAQYCSGGPSSTSDSNVETVDLLGDGGSAIAYTGCPGVTGTEDLTGSQIVNVTAGSSYTANVLFGTCGGNYSGVGEAWIDWDQSGTFDASESIGTWTGTPPSAAATAMAFTVPLGAYNCVTRMRVMQREGGSLPLNPCSSYSWGSVVDFSVVVSGGAAPLICAKPITLTATGITATAANLGWVESCSATSWEVEYGTAGFAIGTGTSTIITTTTTLALTTLTASSSYDFYVRSICGIGDTSIWSSGSFNTQTFAPWYENFNNGTSIPNGWTSSATTGGPWNFGNPGFFWNTSGCGPGPNDHTGDGSGYAAMDQSSSDAGVIIETDSINVSSLTTPYLEFYYWMCATGYSPLNILVVEAYNGTGWDTVSAIQQGSASWTEYAFDISANVYNTNWVKIRFRSESGGSFADYYGDQALDDIAIYEMPTCPKPDSLSVASISSTGATLGWNENGSATSWYVEYGATGFTQGSGTMALSTNDSLVLTTLNAITNYEFYVRAFCGVADSSIWVGPMGFTTNCTGSLSGVYTLNPASPISATNYQSMDSFIQQLGICGISGAVTLNVAANSGPYVGPWDFGSYPGSSVTNTVTINGNGNVVNKNPSENHFVRFEGTSYFTINDFEFINQTPAISTFGIQMRLASDHISITNNTIDVGTHTGYVGCITASNSTTSPASSGDNASNVTISGNELIGGYYCVSLYGVNSSTPSKGHTITNNNVHDFYSTGIRLYYADSAFVNGNEVSRANRATTTTFYGIYGYYMTNTKVMNNRIHSNGVTTSTAYPIYLSQSNNAIGFETEFINNAIYNLQSTGTIYGMYLTGTRNYINLYNNTVEIGTSGTGTRRGVYFSGAPNNHNFKNNIVSVSGTGTGTSTGIYSSSTSVTLASDNNDVYVNTSGSSYYGYWSGYTATLALWQTATSQAANSSESNPVFTNISTGNFSPLSMSIDNMGVLVGVLTDIDGTTRSLTTPDVGAVEFTGIPGDLEMTDAILMQENGCYGTADTAFALVSNILGSTVDFSVNPLTIVWMVTGPVNTTDSLVVSTGTMDVGADSIFSISTINMSTPGDYDLSVYIKPNPINAGPLNDTLTNVHTETVDTIITVSPDSITVTSPFDMPVLSSASPLFPSTDYVIEFYDSFGDGWNGNNIEITHGSIVDVLTLSSGSSGSFNISVNNGDTLNINYLGGGAWNNEVSFILNDASGLAVYSSGLDPATGYHYGTSVVISPIVGLSWDSAGVTVGGHSSINAGPFTTTGVYTYVANYVSMCGTYSDSSIITVDLTNATLSASTNVSCNAGDNGTATVTAGGGDAPYTYVWSNGDITAMADTLSAGTYTVTVYDANMWPATATVTITEPTALSASTSVTPSTCGVPSGSATVVASGGTGALSYLWSDAAGSTTATATGLVGGPYTVTITDANMCTMMANATVTDIGAPTISINVDNIVTCFGDSTGQVTATGTGGSTPYSFVWSSGGSLATETGLALGTYTVTLTDNSGCFSTGTVNMTQNPALLAVVTGSTDPLCNGDATGTATSIAGGGIAPYTFAWSNGDMVANATALVAGSHTVTVTDAVNCMQTAVVNISQPNQLAGVFVNVTDVSCNGGSTGSAGVLATGGTAPYGYSWSNSSTSSMATSLSAGFVTVTVTDANNCAMTDSVNVAEPTALVASTTGSTDALCFGGNTGTATASAAGGTMPYVYAWSNGAGGTLATGLMAGTYTVSVSDANNCQSTDVIVVGQPTMAVSIAVSSTNASCNGVSDGGATAVGAGGTAGYTYSWSNGSNTGVISGLAAGPYSVTATDANGCATSASTSVTEPTVLMASTTSTDVTCNGGNDGQSTAMATGGTSPYGYTWSNGPTTALNSSVMAGGYSVVVMDANGCIANASSVVSEPAAIVVNLGADVTICSDEVFTLDAGAGYASYAWDDASTSQTRDIDAAVAGPGSASYNVSVLTAAGCDGSDTIIVTVADPVTTTIIVNGASELCQYDLTSMDAGPGFASYTWSNTSNGQITNIYGSNYTAGMNAIMVTVTDVNGCEGVAVDSILVHPEVVVTLPADTMVWKEPVYTIMADSGFASYTWNTGETSQSIDVTASGSYSVVVTDSISGCEGSDEMVVNFVLGVNNPNSAQLKLYPNPAVDYINLEFSNFVQQGTVEIQILSITGQLVRTVNVDVSASNGTSLIDVSKLAVGTYMVTFDYDGQYVVKQFTIK